MCLWAKSIGISIGMHMVRNFAGEIFPLTDSTKDSTQICNIAQQNAVYVDSLYIDTPLIINNGLFTGAHL